MCMSKCVIIGVFAVFVSVVFSAVAQDSVKPFDYRKDKKHYRFVFPGGQEYETWNVIIVSIPGRVKLTSQEFNERISVTVANIRTEYWPWIPIYINHPIKGLILYEPKILVWPLKIPFR